METNRSQLGPIIFFYNGTELKISDKEYKKITRERLQIIYSLIKVALENK